MKKIALHCLSLWLLFNQALLAQSSTRFEGKVEYEVRNVQANTEYKQALEKAQISNFSTNFPQVHYYQGSKMRVDLILAKSAVASATEIIIYDGLGNEYIALEKITSASGGSVENLGNKKIERVYCVNTEIRGTYQSRVELEEDITKTIMGKTCQKSTVFNDFGTEMIVFYSTSIKPRPFGAMSKLPGFPLKICTPTLNGMYSELTAISVTEQPLSDAVFQVPAGYRKVDSYELQRILTSY